MPLTDEYKALLKAEHGSRVGGKQWGTTGARNAGADVVRCLTGRGDVKTVLDFGSGQGSLGKLVLKELPYLDWTNYDPGMPGIDELPTKQFDFIVSSDVMEHVEPTQIDATIAWMRDHARKGMFHHIACSPSKLILPDGRDAHLTVREPGWWRIMFDDPGWALMFFADCLQRKRGGLRRHCVIQLDKLGG